MRQTVRAALYGKALPLALAAMVLTVLFLPDVLTITLGGIKAFFATGIHAFHGRALRGNAGPLP